MDENKGRAAATSELSAGLAPDTWNHINDVLAVMKMRDEHKWTWAFNSDCKYLDVRIDMRDGGCIIKDRNGRRITPEQLAWQYSKDTPTRPGANAAGQPRCAATSAGVPLLGEKGD